MPQSLAPESLPVPCNVKDSKATSVDVRQVPLKLPCLWMHHLSTELEGTLLFQGFSGTSKLADFWSKVDLKGPRWKDHKFMTKPMEAQMYSSCDPWRWGRVSKQWQFVFHILQRAAEHNWWFPREFVDYKHSKKGCFCWSWRCGKHSPNHMEVGIMVFDSLVPPQMACYRILGSWYFGFFATFLQGWTQHSSWWIFLCADWRLRRHGIFPEWAGSEPSRQSHSLPLV